MSDLVTTQETKPRGRPFQKGLSGNPSGRPKEVGHVRELAQEKTEGAIETLATIMEDRRAPHNARVAAATALLDRGWGKPTQPLEGGENQQGEALQIVIRRMGPRDWREEEPTPVDE